MPAKVTVTGADQWGKLAKALRDAPKDLKQAYRGIARAVRPLTDEVKRSAEQYVPDDYARELERTLRFRTRRRGGQDPGITLIATAKARSGKKRELHKLNDGRLRHPLFGDRRHWFDQRVKPGLWDDTLRANVDMVRRELLKVMDDIAKKVARSA